MSNGGIDDIKVGDVKSLVVRLLLHHGPWAALTVALIGTILGWFPSPLSKDIETLRDVVLENRVVIKQTIRQAEIDHGYQNVLLRAICRNSVVLQQQGQCEPKYYGYEEKTK